VQWESRKARDLVVAALPRSRGFSYRKSRTLENPVRVEAEKVSHRPSISKHPEPPRQAFLDKADSKHSAPPSILTLPPNKKENACCTQGRVLADSLVPTACVALSVEGNLHACTPQAPPGPGHSVCCALCCGCPVSWGGGGGELLGELCPSKSVANGGRRKRCTLSS
jgi:hypothetical protein